VSVVTPAVVAVDGGNSKTDVALVARDGRLLGASRGPTVSHQQVGLETGMTRLRALVARAAGADSARRARLGVFCLAGADYGSDVRRLTQALGPLGLAVESAVLNDSFAALRAGTERPWGVAVICGRGVNGAGIAPDGRTARFAGVGEYSGDWGGGHSMALAALAAAVRAEDGRGPDTSLEAIVPRHFGLARPAALTRALYEERIHDDRLDELSPLVFDAAIAGDRVARGIVNRMGDEIVAMATALIRRLRLAKLDVEVVLAGGVFRAEDRAFYDRIDLGVRLVAPDARLVRLSAPPVLGAALLGLDRLHKGSTPQAAAARIRAALAAWLPRRIGG
jgi:N-acetylglucosamine kinase-like BadF-type ATPase